MRVVVAGGTGLVGAEVVERLDRGGHEAVVIARSRGVDLLTGEGLDQALAGADAVIDVTNTAETDPDRAVEFFGRVSGQLVAAERRVGVPHHVLLSIVGVDRVEGNGHYAGKRRQEEAAVEGAEGFSLLRATQFFEFAAMVVGWARDGEEATVPPLLVRPVSVADVALALVEISTGGPGVRKEIAGPHTEDLVDMARRTLAVRGRSIRLDPSWQGGIFGPEMAGEILLPSPGARIAETTFDSWLAAGAEAPPRPLRLRRDLVLRSLGKLALALARETIPRIARDHRLACGRAMPSSPLAGVPSSGCLHRVVVGLIEKANVAPDLRLAEVRIAEDEASFRRDGDSVGSNPGDRQPTDPGGADDRLLAGRRRASSSGR